MPALVTLPNIVIIDTGINYTTYKDCNHFTYMDVEYNVSMRFTREGKLNFSIFPTDETVKNNKTMIQMKNIVCSNTLKACSRSEF